MADNTTVNPGSGGDTIRDKDRSGVKTQIVALDLNPAGAESLMGGSMPVTQASPPDIAGTLTNGRQTVPTPGTPVALRASLACKWVTLTAFATNADRVHVGGSGVVAASGSQTGVPLAPGVAVTIPVPDASSVYLDARVANDGVAFLVGS